MENATSLRMIFDPKLSSAFDPLLQKGVGVRVQVGVSLTALFSEQFGMKAEYVKERIKTIFLDGKPVDDLGTALVKDGSSLALSAAMPGLAGATLRRGSSLALFRSQITHLESQIPLPQSEGFIFLKLFNLLLPELGPAFLRQGVYLPREDMEHFLKSAPDQFWNGCQEAQLDGKELEVDKLRALHCLGPHPRVFLSVYFSPP